MIHWQPLVNNTSHSGTGYATRIRAEDPITRHATGSDRSRSVGTRAKLHARRNPADVVDRHRHKMQLAAQAAMSAGVTVGAVVATPAPPM